MLIVYGILNSKAVRENLTSDQVARYLLLSRLVQMNVAAVFATFTYYSLLIVAFIRGYFQYFCAVSLFMRWL